MSCAIKEEAKLLLKSCAFRLYEFYIRDIVWGSRKWITFCAGGSHESASSILHELFSFFLSSETRLVSSIRCTLFLFPSWIFIKELIMSPLLLVSFCSGMSATHLRSFLQLNGFQICFVSFSCYSRVCAKSFWCGHTVHLLVRQMSFQFCEIGGLASVHKRT